MKTNFLLTVLEMHASSYGTISWPLEEKCPILWSRQEWINRNLVVSDALSTLVELPETLRDA